MSLERMPTGGGHAPAWMAEVQAIVEHTVTSSRFRFITFCTYDPVSRTTRSLSHGGWQQPLLERAFTLMRTKLPAYNPLGAATSVDANSLMPRIVDGHEPVTASIEAYTAGMIPPVFARILGQVAGGAHVLGLPVIVRGRVVGILTGYQRHAQIEVAQRRHLEACRGAIVAVLGHAAHLRFRHGDGGDAPMPQVLPHPLTVSTPRDSAPAGLAPRPVREDARHLTERQRELWALIAMGLSNTGIAERLAVSGKWIDNAVGPLYTALGIDTSDPGINPRVVAATLYHQDEARVDRDSPPRPHVQA